MSNIKNIRGAELLESFDTFVFDADGVLWLGSSCLPAADDFVRHLFNQGKNVFIATNNSTKTIDDYMEKCKSLGFDLVPRNHIVSPATVVAHMLAKERSNLPVYLIGSPGLEKELRNEGIESFGVGPDPVEKYATSGFIYDVDVTRPVQAVLVSFDIHINYLKVMKAANYIQQKGVKFIATNEDTTFPGPIQGVCIPGSGMCVSAVKSVVGKKPIVVGKPSKPMFDYLKDRFNIDPKRAVMFGDRCETDIKFGKDCGMKAVLVGTGIHSHEDANNFEKSGRADLTPDFYAPSLYELYHSL